MKRAVGAGLWALGAVAAALGLVWGLHGESRPGCEELEARVQKVQDQRRQLVQSLDNLSVELREVVAEARGRCPGVEARAHNGLGVIAISNGDLLQTLDHLDDAEALIPDLPDEAQTQIFELEIAQNRGVVYQWLGWLVDADEVLTPVMEKFRELGQAKGTGESAMHLARTRRLLGDREGAARAIRTARRHFEDLSAVTRSAVWQEKARQSWAVGHLEEAEAHLQQALTEAEKERGLDPVLFMDRVELLQDQSKWRRADELLRGKRALVERLKEPFYLIHLRFVESRSLAFRGDLKAAIVKNEEGLELIDGFSRSWIRAADELVALRRRHERQRLALAVESDGPRGALAVFERRKARALLRSLWREDPVGEPTCSLGEVAWKLDQASVDDERELRRELLRCRRDRRLGSAENVDPASEMPADLEAVRVKLDADPALVVAALPDRHYVIWWPPGEEPEGRVLDLSPSDLEAVADWSRLRDRSLAAEPDPMLEKLGRGLLGPLLNRLDAYDRVWVTADGPLDGFPLEVLRRPDDGRLLFESHAVSYLPSLSALRPLRKAADGPGGSVLVLGDPVYRGGEADGRWPMGVKEPRSGADRSRWVRLRSSRLEAEGVAAAHPQAVLLLDGEAERRRWAQEAPRHSVLHLATHARSDHALPERSRILFSCVDHDGNALERCDLYLGDISALELRGQVVVLSACEGHAGRRRAGEGPLGLSRAFLSAGASAVVASLWQVPDLATAELMTRFHRHLAAGASVDRALRQAKLDALAQGLSPEAWGAFVVYGDGAQRPFASAAPQER